MKRMVEHSAWVGALVMSALLVTGCPASPPLKAFEDAKGALKGATAAGAGKCAEDELRSAKALMKAARKLMGEGKYEQAKTRFEAARKLARQAQAKAAALGDRCRKRAIVSTVVPRPPRISASGEQPQADTRTTLDPVYFSFNEYTLTESSRNRLRRHGEYLARRKTIKIEVQGHCDQRGSVEYNLALGERRALAVKRFLIRMGVPRKNVSIISYGHQRPADPRNNSTAWAKNRRAEFRISR